MIKVSVIIPVYNVEQYIRQCVLSILNQTLKDIELILVNDGSEDKSMEVIEDLIECNSNIIVINKKNGGLSSARNEGIRHARGTYLMFVDSDDYIESDYIEILYNQCIKHNLDIAIGNYKKLIETKLVKETRKGLTQEGDILTGTELMYKLCKSNNYRPEVWDDMYKTEYILKNKLYFQEGILHEDEDFTPKALVYAERVKFVNSYGYIYRQRNNSIMNSSININNINGLIVTINNLINLYNNTDDEYGKQAINENLLRILSMILYNIKTIDLKNKKILYNQVPVKDLIGVLAEYKNIKNIIRIMLLKIDIRLYYFILKKSNNIKLKLDTN